MNVLFYYIEDYINIDSIDLNLQIYIFRPLLVHWIGSNKPKTADLTGSIHNQHVLWDII